MSDKHERPRHSENGGRPGYETTDVSGRLVPIVATVVIVGSLVLMPLLWWMFTSLLAGSKATQPALSPLANREKDRLPVGPVLEGIESPDMARDRLAANEAILRSYGWADHKEQVVRIPIDRAIAIEAGKLKSASKEYTGAATGEDEMPRGSNSGRMMKENSP
jgi:hypothetical protein